MKKEIVTEVMESMHLGDFSQATIRDLQSLNGTFLNGQQLEPNVDCRLYDGDEIMLYSQKLIVSIEHAKN